MRRQPTSPARRPVARFRRPRLGLELLEEREVPATLSLALANAALVENGDATTATVTRTGDLSQALSVAIANSDATEAAAPTSVVIPAGSASATFTVAPVDDIVVDGTQAVTLTATAATGPLVVRPDPSFGLGGYSNTPAIRGGDSVNPGAVLVHSTGTIVAAASVNTGAGGWAVQFQNPDGLNGGTTYVSFPGYAGDGTVFALAELADGKVLVAGDVRTPNGVSDWALTRLNADGTHDPSFGTSGTVVIPHLGYDSIYDLEVTATGDILVGGFWGDSSAFRVTRLSGSGAVLNSVNVPVYTLQDGERVYANVYDMALDADGKLLLAGQVTVQLTSTGAQVNHFGAVARLNADLTPDATFGPDGVRTLTGGSFGYADLDVTAVEVVGGKVVVAGTAYTAVLNPRNGLFAVARFNDDGTLDTSFAGDGTTALSLPAGDHNSATALDLLAQPDGKLVLAGYAWRNGTNQALARFHPNGTPDASFNGTGYYVAAEYPALGSFEQVNAVALQPDGRLVAQAGGTTPVTTGGTTTMESRQWIARFDMATGEALAATASLTVADDDPMLTLTISPASFSENGGTATATLTRTNLQMGADLVVTLSSSDATEASVPATVTIPANQASVTFTASGVDDDQPDGTQAVTISATGGNLTATAGVSVTDDDPAGPALIVTIDRTGVLEQTGTNAAVGTVRRYGFSTAQPLVVTLQSSDVTEATVPTTVTIPAGQLTATFPIATTDDTFIDGTIGVTITASVTVAGMSGPITHDTSWNGSGYQGGFPRGRVVALPGGGLVAAGTTGTVGSNADFAVRRFLANGTADGSFGSGGYVQLNPTGPSDQVEAVLVQADGKVVIAGTAGTTEMIVIRLTNTGLTDGSFGQNGVVRLALGTVSLFDVAIQPDGKLVLSGSIDADFAVVRLNADGSRDSTFGTDGVVRSTLPLAAKAYGVAVSPDGSIVAVGSVGEGSGASQGLAVARYSAAGVPVAGFGNSGVVVIVSSGYDERATDVSVQPDGKILVAAQLRNTSTGLYDFAALRFHADGTADNSFATGGQFTEPAAGSVSGVPRLILQPDGRVLLVGTATSSPYARFVRLTSAGVVENRNNGAYGSSSTEDVAQDAAGNISLAYKYGGSSGWIDRYKSAGTPVIGTAPLNVLDNEPFAAAADSFTTTEETPLTVGGPGVRGNDTVTAGINVTAELVSGPTRGTLSFNADGSFTYTPNANFAGTDTFTYRLRDGVGVSNTATVTLAVTNTPDAPVAVNDSYTVAEDGTLTVSATAGATSLNMVSDPGDWIGQGQTYNLSPSTGNFSLSGNPSYLTVNYQNPANTSDYWSLTFRSPYDNVPLTAGQYLGATRAAFRTPGNPGLDVTGRHRGSNTLTGFFTVLQIEVSPNGQVTRFAADFEQHSEGGTPALRGSVRFNYAPGGAGVLANDTDPDGDALSALLVSGPAHGQLSLNANGTLTYTPHANYFGPDSFTYEATDGALDSNVATVSINVTAVNDPPVGANDSATTAEDTPVLIDVLANDTDPEGQALLVGALTQPSQGTVAVVGGQVRYTPPANWSGTTTFTYRPYDTGGIAPNGNVTTVTVTVTPAPDAPVATANAYTTDQGVALTVNAPGVLGNDTDADGDSLTAVVESGPANGALTLNADGSFTYAPDPAFFGTDTFTYTAADGTGLFGTATVTLTVLRTNDPPVANPDSFTTNEDQQLGLEQAALLGNDTDPNGDPLTVVILAQPANGTAAVSPNNGWVYYTPRPNFHGTDTFTYRAYDGRAYSEPTTVTITVLPVNDAPVAVNNSYTVAEDNTLTVAAPGLLTNDTDADGDALTPEMVTFPASGSVALNPNGGFTYTPVANYFGTVTFGYRVSDGTAWSNTATVTITVTSVNDAPVGNPDAATINEDTPFLVMYGASAGAVTFNDTDAENASTQLAIGAVSQPQYGTLEPAVTFAGYIYRPPLNWSGTDTFQYRPRDLNQALGNWTTVTITVLPVNDAPIGRPDGFTTVEDTPLTVPAAGVLANDSDVEGSPFTAQVVAQPANGQLTLAADGSFTYYPNLNFAGTDTFSYRPVEGQLLGNVTTVTVTVTAVNDAPVANPNTFVVAEDGVLSVSGNATALDQQSLLGGQFYNAGAAGTRWEQSVVAGRAGTLASFDLVVSSNSVVGAAFDVFLHRGGPSPTATPLFSTRLTVTQAMLGQFVTFDVTVANVALVAGETFTIGTKNGSGQTAGVGGSFSANGQSYAPGRLWYNGSPLGAGSAYDSDLTFRTRMTAAGGVLANDFDPENSPLTASVVNAPQHGVLSLSANGGFVYLPNADYFGPDSFTYRAYDGALYSNVATVSIMVTGVNDAPTLADIAGVTVAEDSGPTVVNLSGIGAGPNETQTLTVTASSSNTALVPTPAVDYTSPSAAGTLTVIPVADGTGTATITVTVSDGQLTAVRQFTVTVTPVNDAPVASDDAATVAEDGAVTVSVLANDTDTDGDPLTVTAATNGANGTVSFTATGVTYTPAANFHGTDSFTYTISDGAGGTATASVSVTVTPVNDAPVATADSATVAEDGSASVDVLANDTDIDGGPLTVTGATNGANGTVSFSASGVTYTPAANFFGTDSFTYTVSDGTATATATVSVTVTPVNDAPTLSALTGLTILEDAGLQTVSLGGIGAGPGESQLLTVTASSNITGLIPNPAVSYTSPNTAGTLTFTPVANANGTATITVTVSDGALTVSRQFTVTVTAVNDAPGFTAGANQSVVAGSGPRTVNGWATGVSRGPADEANQGLAFTVTTTNAALFVAAPSIDATGALTFIPEASATGTATVTVVLKDTGGTANGGADTSVTRTFTITVTSNGLPTSSGVRMVGSELVVTGGSGADTVTVTPQTNNRVRVTLNGQSSNHSLGGVTRLRVDTKGGNDTVNLSAISLTTWTDAGTGDDTVTGGGGADQVYLGAGNDTADGGGGNDLIAGGAGEDLIQGGAGDDDLYGGDNDDFVIGGPGLDDLYGGLGNDILVGGTAAVRSGSDSLRKVLTDWNPASSGVGGYGNLRGRLLITDDGVADRLRGDDGTDWFWVGGVDLELDTPEQRN